MIDLRGLAATQVYGLMRRQPRVAGLLEMRSGLEQRSSPDSCGLMCISASAEAPQLHDGFLVVDVFRAVVEHDALDDALLAGQVDGTALTAGRDLVLELDILNLAIRVMHFDLVELHRRALHA